MSVNASVLVAEDDLATRELLSCLLGGRGYAVVAAASGAEAWECLQGSAPPRILLLDWHLPDLTGIEICQRLRLDERLAASYVIILSGDNDSESMRGALSAGADAWLGKPFELEDLFARLEQGRRELGEAAG